MQNRCAYVVMFLFIVFFLLKWGFLWNYLITHNVIINIFLLTHPPKTSDWHFTWQNEIDVAPKGMLRSMFCTDINKHSDRKCKIMLNLFKQPFFKNVLAFIDLFHRYHYIHHFIYSDCMWRHVCTICNSITLT